MPIADGDAGSHTSVANAITSTFDVMINGWLLGRWSSAKSSIVPSHSSFVAIANGLAIYEIEKIVARFAMDP